jgi:3-dehydroquinate synthase
MTRLPLSLGYDVVLAPGFAGLGAELARVLGAGRCVLVTNDVVGPLHAAAALAELGHWDVTTLTLPDGEAHKDEATWSRLCRSLLDAGVDRRTPLLALGGGVTGDMAGFAAATVLRGLPFVQVPTTVLAMVDASVGGKTGVNTPHGKNLLGSFHQPRLVWAPLEVLGTLPPAERRCGLGEVVKHALIAGEAALAELERDATALAAGDGDALARAIAMSVRTKAAIVEEDPLECGRRAVLNLGHTLGHALESVLGYGELRHGEAVALGLVAACRFGVAQGMTDPSLPGRTAGLLAALGLPTVLPRAVDPAELARAAGFDKKRERGMVKLVLCAAPGDVRLVPHPLTSLLDLALTLA